ncbi:MAG: hypothetical protein KIT34_15365 [Cyanobacteria bacterium TGS_CYA1]|nr:hypothetical protein [Cyanobacteria bacterium TGS_CYA1]
MKKIFVLSMALTLSWAPLMAQTSNEYKLAMASFQTKNYKEAAVFFLKAMASEPKNPKAYYYAGYCLYINGRKEDAFNTFKLLVNTMPNTKEALQAKAFLKQNDRNYSYRLRQTPGSSTTGIGTSTSTKSEKSTNSADYYVSKLVEVHKPRGKVPAVSATYVAEIQRLLMALPLSVLKELCDNKAKVSLYPSVVENDYRMQNTRPRGWDEGTSWSESSAFCRGTEVVVSQYVISRSTGEYEDASDEVGAVRHEVGHALDHCRDITDAEDWKHAHRLEAARVPAEMRKKLDYYIKPESGASETWAELFNEKFGGYTDRGRGDISAQVKAHFPNCNKLMEKKLRELDLEN